MGRLARVFATLAALTGCAPPPSALIGSRSAEVTSARYPTLAPVDELLAAAPAAPETDPAAPVLARAANLRVRAAKLRALDPSG